MTTRSWLIGAFCALGLAAAASAQTTMKINVSAAQNSHHGVGIDVFAIVEQDMYPCPVDAPLPIARRTRNYLGSCGIPSVRF